MTKQKCSFGRIPFDKDHYHICNFETVKIKASPDSTLGSRIKAMLAHKVIYPSRAPIK